MKNIFALLTFVCFTSVLLAAPGDIVTPQAHSSALDAVSANSGTLDLTGTVLSLGNAPSGDWVTFEGVAGDGSGLYNILGSLSSLTDLDNEVGNAASEGFIPEIDAPNWSINSDGTANFANFGNISNTAFSGTVTIGNGSITIGAAGQISALVNPTNLVLTTGSYSDPAWLTLSKTKVGLSNVSNTAFSGTYSAGNGSITIGAAGQISAFTSPTNLVITSNNGSDFSNVATVRTNLKTPFSKHVAKSANFSVAAADCGTVFDVTTSTNSIVVTLDTAANLGTNFQCLIRKVDAAAGTIVANSQMVAVNNHWIEVDSDGTTIRSKTIQGAMDSSGNFTLSTGNNGNINLSPNGTGTINLNGPVAASGNIVANGTHNTAPNQVGVTPASSDLITTAQLDARAGVFYKLILSADLSAPSTSFVTSTDSVTLPAGTYRFYVILHADTASSTAGISAQLIWSTECSGGCWVAQNYTSSSQGSTFAALTASSIQMRSDVSVAAYMCSPIGDAPIKTACGISQGTVTFASSTTLHFQVGQRSATDGSNPTILRAKSFIVFQQLP